ncbi:MAG: Gfo/Idh/MocA family protein [Candidatus Limnocylindrales bacterium]
MSPTTRVRVGVIGTGLMARHHLRTMLDREDTVVPAVCEPSDAAWGIAASEFTERGLALPPNEPDWQRFVTRFGGDLDAVLIVTPHALHHDQTVAFLEAGVDVLLEKPMVLDATEAASLISTRDRTGRLLVVAFPGSLSPQVRTAAAMIRAGELGAILNIDAVAWQDWHTQAHGTWRQVPELSGGGFLFDTGAHMLNTVADLAGEDVTEVAAWLVNDGAPVDLRGVVMARIASGALITMNACGRAIPSLGSDIRVFCERATLRTGIWGERLEIQRDGDEALAVVDSVQPGTVWEQFLDVRSGRIANPSPPEVGLRMAHLWDAIRASAAVGGAVVRLTGAIGGPA